MSCISSGGKAPGPGVLDIAAAARKLTISCIVSRICVYEGIFEVVGPCGLD